MWDDLAGAASRSAPPFSSPLGLHSALSGGDAGGASLACRHSCDAAKGSFEMKGLVSKPGP